MSTVNKNINIIINSSFQNVLGMSFGFFLAFLNTLLLTRNFTITEYGIFGVVLLVTDYIFIISILGFNEGVTKFISSSKQELIKDKVLSVFSISVKLLLPFTIICSLILYSQAPLLSSLFEIPKLSYYLKLFALVIPFNALLQIIVFSYRGIKKTFEKVLFLDILPKLLRTTFFLFIIYNEMNFDFIIYSYVLSIFVSSILLLVYFSKDIGLLNFPEESVDYNDILKFSFPFLLTTLIWKFQNTLDRWLISLMNSSDDLAIYNIGLLIIDYFKLIVASVGFMLLPVLSSLIRDNNFTIVSSTYYQLTRIILLFIYPIILILVLFSEELLTSLFGSKYVEGYFLLIVSSTTFFLNSITGPKGIAIISYGRSNYLLSASLITTIASIFPTYYLIKIHGILGAIFATSFTLIFFNLLLFWFLSKKLDLQPFDRKYFNYILLISLNFILSLLIKFYFTWNLLLVIFSFALLSFIFIQIHFYFFEDDKKLIKSFMRVGD